MVRVSLCWCSSGSVLVLAGLIRVYEFVYVFLFAVTSTGDGMLPSVSKSYVFIKSGHVRYMPLRNIETFSQAMSLTMWFCNILL